MSPHNKGLVLSLNSGSSSLKISLYSFSSPPVLILTSSIANISSPPAKFSFKSVNAPARHEDVQSITDHASAFSYFLGCLKRETDIGRSRISHICHRVVHGGDYTDPVVINEESYNHIEALSDLAPLHNGAALSVIKACISDLPGAKSIAYFDTAFHRSIPPHIASCAIDQNIARSRGLKKYGFHGLSYAFILRSASQHFNKPPSSLNLIILHLGSGASACAIEGGRSLDTSMGLTPVSGLPGATRSGAIDPSLIFHYTNKAGRITHDPRMAVDLHVTEAEEILNKRSGWKALTGTTDFREITSRAELASPSPADNPHRLAFDLFVDRILNYIGAYYLKLHGRVDALVFSGGIGEKSVELRAVLGERAACLGFGGGRGVDARRNAGVEGEGGVVVDIGFEGEQGGEKRILVCRTDEQLEMARECTLDKTLWED